MKIALILNGKNVEAEVDDGMTLYDFVRLKGCTSVKCGCETSNCGLCTVFLDDVPVLSCSVLAARAAGRRVDTLEGLQEEAEEFGAFIAGQGAEQCGFCNPGMIMNAIALFREKTDPTDEEIQEHLAGNLCRCSGYEGQMRGIRNFIAYKKEKALSGERQKDGSMGKSRETDGAQRLQGDEQAKEAGKQEGGAGI